MYWIIGFGIGIGVLYSGSHPFWIVVVVLSPLLALFNVVYDWVGASMRGRRVSRRMAELAEEDDSMDANEQVEEDREDAEEVRRMLSLWSILVFALYSLCFQAVAIAVIAFVTRGIRSLF